MTWLLAPLIFLLQLAIVVRANVLGKYTDAQSEEIADRLGLRWGNKISNRAIEIVESALTHQCNQPFFEAPDRTDTIISFSFVANCQDCAAEGKHYLPAIAEWQRTNTIHPNARRIGCAYAICTLSPTQQRSATAYLKRCR